MIDAMTLLTERNSAPKLIEPAPGAAVREAIFAAALRAPDHAWLRPWRFLTVEGEARQALGSVLERSLLRREPEADATARERARCAPLRAPLVVVVLARLKAHPKVPPLEQRLSAGCAAHGILLATEAQGYAGIWRTGAAAFDREVVRELGGGEDEEIVAFLYLGSREGKAKRLPAMAVEDFVAPWNGPTQDKETP
ncbi:Nitroreductase family protein [Pseudohaliea rubra DSM 19751]|uniref:Putative NAD(P)H nitroreductase n=2 Tax=Pseudohaliea TaxID=1341120 RepID=A0A095X2Q4_9GAMM|nr:Nitroreductase family protein [Pseudohaliea rubra DSM 19751]